MEAWIYLAAGITSIISGLCLAWVIVYGGSHVLGLEDVKQNMRDEW